MEGQECQRLLQMIDTHCNSSAWVSHTGELDRMSKDSFFAGLWEEYQAMVVQLRKALDTGVQPSEGSMWMSGLQYGLLSSIYFKLNMIPSMDTDHYDQNCTQILMTSWTPVSKQDHCNKVIGAQAAKVDEESDADEQLRSWIMNCSMKKVPHRCHQHGRWIG